MNIKRRFLLVLGGLLTLCGCSRVELLNLTIPHDGYTVIADVPYGDDPRQKLDIYRPDRPAPGNPVIVFYYGGSWQMGSKDDYLFVGEAFASRGYTTVIADYRLYPKISFPTFLQDNAAAYVWTHQHIADYGGNSDHMFIGGHSAGAYNAIMLTVNREYLSQAGGQAEWIKGAFGLAGPYDFVPLTDPKLIAMFGGDNVPATQPITFAKPNLPPFLFLHGDKDTDVLLRNGYHMTDKLRQNGDDVTFDIYRGFDHIDIILALAHGFRDKGPVLDTVDQFIKSHTK